MVNARYAYDRLKRLLESVPVEHQAALIAQLDELRQSRNYHQRKWHAERPKRPK